MIITIDGGPGTGKSTLARYLANFYQLDHLSSGELYRLYAALPLATREECIRRLSAGDFKLLLDVESMRSQLRSADVAREATIQARNPELRQAIRTFVRIYCAQRDVVVDGRDMSITLPAAEIKFRIFAERDDRQRLAESNAGESFDEIEWRRRNEVPFDLPFDCHDFQLLDRPQEISFAAVHTHLGDGFKRLRGPGQIICQSNEVILVRPDVNTVPICRDAATIFLPESTRLPRHELSRACEAADLLYTYQGDLGLPSSDTAWIRVSQTPAGPVLFSTNIRTKHLMAPPTHDACIFDTPRALRGLKPGGEAFLRYEAPAIEILIDAASRHAGSVIVRLEDRVDGSGSRGAERLIQNPDEIREQVRSIRGAMQKSASLKLLVPFVRHGEEGREIHRLIREVSPAPIGAMLEVPLALHDFEPLSRIFDFFVIGMGDMTTLLSGGSRSDPALATGADDLVYKLLQVYVQPIVSASPGLRLYATSSTLAARAAHELGIQLAYLHKPLGI